MSSPLVAYMKSPVIPKVTVIVPNYNHEMYLQQRLDSILTQTFPDFEIILLDDASKDASVAILSRYQANVKVQRLIVNETNSGSPFKQWNKGLQFARGEYVWIAESDDYADPKFLEQLVARMEANKDVGIAYCQSFKVDAASNVFGSTADWTASLGAERWSTDYVCSGEEECTKYMTFRCIIPNVSCALFRRQALENAGGADDSMRYCGDYSTYVRVLGVSSILYVAQSLNYFRFSTASVRTKMSGAWLHDYERAEVLNSIFSGFDVPIETREQAVRAFLESILRTALSSRQAFATYAAGYFRLRRSIVRFRSRPEWSLLSVAASILWRRVGRALT